MNLRNKLFFSGLLIYPLSLICTYYFFCEIFSKNLTMLGHLMLWGIALIPSLLLFVRNLYDYIFNDKREFSLIPVHNPTSISPEKKKSMYPPIPSEYLSHKLQSGFIMGKDIRTHKYFIIRLNPNNILHGCIIGAPGSGKSVLILNWLINNFMQKIPPMTVFVIDIKPELALKSVEIYDNPFVRIINPTDRNSWGWDVYYQLSSASTDDQILHVLDGIARALIISNNPKDEFFVNQAQNIFKGICFYYYKKDVSFVDTIKSILSNDISSHIKKILADKVGCPERGKAYSLLKKFADKDSDAFQDIELTLVEHLDIFLSNDIKWMLDDNPLKASPEDLNKDISVFLSLPEIVIDEYKDVFRLISFQVLDALQSRPEDSKPVAAILDEFARLGAIPKIKDSLATLRSRKVSIWLCFQDLSQIESVYSKEDARTIFNLCEAKVILSCSDNQTNKDLSEMVGNYRETNTSVNSRLYLPGGARKNESTQYHKILEVSDIMTLKATKEVLLIVEGSYYRIKRLRYFENRILNKRYKELIDLNSDESEGGNNYDN